MRLVEWLSMTGIEIANSARTTTYARNLGLSGATFSADCPCDIIDAGYDSPAADPAPWYEITRPESEEFFGFFAHSMRLEPVMGREVTQTKRYGSVVAPARFRGRQVQVEGMLVSQTMQGMAYGERWLAEVLRGTPCDDGKSPSDDACILPACPEDPYDGDAFYRTLVNVGCADGPTFEQLSDLPECFIQQATFLLVSGMPWLYHPTERCLEDEPVMDSYYGQPTSCSLTTPEWMGDGTFVIDVTAQSDVTDLVIEGKVSIDGDCPVVGDGSSVMPCFTYRIPEMKMDDRLVIDGMRRQALWYDASEKFATSLLPHLSFEGPIPWPDVGVCTTVCLTMEVSDGDAVATVDTVLREM